MLEKLNLNISSSNRTHSNNGSSKNTTINPNTQIRELEADTLDIRQKTKKQKKWREVISTSAAIALAAIGITLSTNKNDTKTKDPEEDAKIEAEKIAEKTPKQEKIAHNKEIFNNFITTEKYDNVLPHKLPYGKEGLPLKYSRDNFLIDLSKSLEKLSPAERTNIEHRFNIKLNPTTYNRVGVELEGVPTIPENLSDSDTEQNFANIIKKFTQGNEVLCESHELKEILDSILQEIPEFTAIIGKKQHRTHHYSVDIHTLNNLSSNLSNIKAKELDADSLTVLKYATILHDLGKCFIADCCPDTGHAERSLAIAKPILERLNLKPKIKERILKQIENHHWFEHYNKENMSAQDVVNLFGNKQDIIIAEIMAKSDLANVNDKFQFKCMKILEKDTKKAWEIYEEKMQNKFDNIDRIINVCVAQ